MGAVIWFTIITAACLVFAGFLYDENRDRLCAILLGIAGLTILCLSVFFGAPKELGWSHVPDSAEAYTERLSMGTVY